MKSFQLIAFVIVVLISALIGSRFQKKMDAKDESKKLQLVYSNLKTTSPSSSSQLGKPLNFLVGSHYIGDIKNEKTKTELEAIFKMPHFPVNFFISDPANLAANSGIRVHMGIVEATRFAKIISNLKDINIEPVYTISPIANQSCTTEIQLITKGDSPIQSIEDLAKKNVGIAQNAIGLTAVAFKTLHGKNLKINQSRIYKDPNWGTINLMSGKVDAIIERVEFYSNGEAVGKFGKFSNNTYTDFPNLKIVKTTDYKMPCGILFMRADFSQQDYQDIKNKLKDAFFNPKSKELVSKALKIGSVHEISKDKWDHFQKIINPDDEIDIQAVSQEVIISDN